MRRAEWAELRILIMLFWSTGCAILKNVSKARGSGARLRPAEGGSLRPVRVDVGGVQVDGVASGKFLDCINASALETIGADAYPATDPWEVSAVVRFVRQHGWG